MDDNRSAGRRAKAYLGKIRQTDRDGAAAFGAAFFAAREPVQHRRGAFRDGRAAVTTPTGRDAPSPGWTSWNAASTPMWTSLWRGNRKRFYASAACRSFRSRTYSSRGISNASPGRSSHGKCIMRNGRYTGYTGVHFSTLQTTWLKHNTQIGERGRFSCRSLLY